MLLPTKHTLLMRHISEHLVHEYTPHSLTTAGAVPLVLHLHTADSLQRFLNLFSNKDTHTVQQDLTLLNVVLGSGPPQPAAAPAAPSRLLMLNQLLTATSIWDDQQRQEVWLLIGQSVLSAYQSWPPKLHTLQLLMILPILPACHVLSTLCCFSALLPLLVFWLWQPSLLHGLA